MTAETRHIDVRIIPPKEKHPRIFAALAELGQGERLEIINDHDPKPLWYQLEMESPGQFSWTYLEEGPEVWRIAIARTAGTPAPRPQADPSLPVREARPRRLGPHLDNRGLEPPEPMVRILEALKTMPDDAELTADMDREPLLLYPRLVEQGYAYDLTQNADGTYLLRIWREG